MFVESIQSALSRQHMQLPVIVASHNRLLVKCTLRWHPSTDYVTLQPLSKRPVEVKRQTSEYVDSLQIVRESWNSNRKIDSSQNSKQRCCMEKRGINIVRCVESQNKNNQCFAEWATVDLLAIFSVKLPIS